MNNEERQDLIATILGIIILVGAFYLGLKAIDTVEVGLRGITSAILICQ